MQGHLNVLLHEYIKSNHLKKLDITVKYGYE